MPAAADLEAYAAVNMPDEDTSTVGGAIDTLRRVDFTPIAADDDVEVISTSASDTQNCTIEARKADGTVVSETLALTGVTAKIFAGNGVVNRVLKVELASVAIGTITVRRSVAGATLRTIPIGERGFLAIFRKCASDPGSTKDYYLKFFWKNRHATQALTSSQVKQNADPAARLTHTLAAAIDDSNTIANRLAVPGAGIIEPDTFDDTAKNVPSSGNLGATQAIGVWLKLGLTAGDSAYNQTYTSELTGQSI